MHISSRANQVRNLSVAAVNGIVTLIILLIAPLGLAAVIINTALVTVATYFTATAADWVVRYLSSSPGRVSVMGSAIGGGTKMRRRQQSETDLSQYD